MATSHYELDTTLNSIDSKLSSVEYRLDALDNKIVRLDKKANCIRTTIWIGITIVVFLRYLDKQLIPDVWNHPITNLLHKSIRTQPQQHDAILEPNNKMDNLESNGDEIDGATSSDITSPMDLEKCGCRYAFSSSTSSGTGKKAKKRLNATEILELIGNFIQVTDRKQYIDHYNVLIKFFINALKTDDTFKYIFKGEVMAGSYRDGLKILKPNEFDTIMRLNFGDKSDLLVERSLDEQLHITIKLNESVPKTKPYLKKFLDTDGYLLRDSITIWLQNLFRDILKPYENNGKIIQIGNDSYQYNASIQGPAFTFKFNVLNTELKFDMDLVPAIPFDYTHWVASRDYSTDSNQVKWIAVPKPPKEGIRRNKRVFTCSYTEMEKHILHDTKQAKNIIRIFKKMRDRQEFPRLKSYFIKTIVLWQFDNTTIAEREEFWTRRLDVIFLDMFRKMWHFVQNRNLPFYWEPEYNLFVKTGESKLKSWDDKLRGIYSRLERIIKENPQALIDVILTSEERQRLECKHPKLCEID